MRRLTVVFGKYNINSEFSISELRKFYDTIYVKCFPNPDERETFENLITYIKRSSKSTEYNYRILLMYSAEQEIVGGCIFDYFKSINTAVIEFIAVRPDVQSYGLGDSLYNAVCEIITNDANDNGYKDVYAIFCEIETPDYTSNSDDKYLNFWYKYGYERLKFNYIQPSLSKSQKPVNGLWLTVFNDALFTMTGAYVLSVLYNYIKYCIGIKNPKRNREYRKMYRELHHREIIEKLPIM